MPEKSLTRAILRVAGAFALAGLLSGCTTLPSDSKVETVEYQACLLTDGDARRPGIADSAVYSLNQAVVTFGIKKNIVESNPSKFEVASNTLVKAKCNLIAIAGSRFTPLIQPLVEANPDIHFLFITDGDDRSLLAANLENLAVYRIDVYESGLLAGHIAASVTANRQLGVVCGSAVNQQYLEGIRAGVEAYDLENETNTTVYSGTSMVAIADVLLPFGCRDQIPNETDNRMPFKLVGYGRDLYADPELSPSKSLVAATVVPQAGPRLFEIIAADLESEFIGGTLGSMVASFGNGGLVISDEHEVPLPSGELDALKLLAQQYETSFK